MRRWAWLVVGALLTGTAACSGGEKGGEQPYTVDVDPADFVAAIDNPYLPLAIGSRWVYEGQTNEGLERTEIEVLADTKVVMGINATVVRDTVSLNGEVIEDTYDWFAQDKAGNVWYLGEASTEYEDGEAVSTAGSWEAGVDGALPGIVMYADPAAHLGETYYQEYYPGEAEDRAEVLSLEQSVTVPAGSFENVLQTLETTALEPGLREHKYYARGVGLVQEVNPGTGQTAVLVEWSGP